MFPIIFGLALLPLLSLSTLTQACVIPATTKYGDALRYVLIVNEEALYLANEGSKLGSAAVATRYESPEVQHRVYLQLREGFLEQVWDNVSVKEVRRGSALGGPITVVPGGFISNIPFLITKPDGSVAPAFPEWQTNVVEWFVLKGFNPEKLGKDKSRSKSAYTWIFKEASQKIYRYYYQKFAWKQPVERIIRSPLKLETIRLPSDVFDYSRPQFGSAWHVTDVIRFVTLTSRDARDLESHMRILFRDFVKLEIARTPSSTPLSRPIRIR